MAGHGGRTVGIEASVLLVELNMTVSFQGAIAEIKYHAISIHTKDGHDVDIVATNTTYGHKRIEPARNPFHGLQQAQSMFSLVLHSIAAATAIDSKFSNCISTPHIYSRGFTSS